MRRPWAGAPHCLPGHFSFFLTSRDMTQRFASFRDLRPITVPLYVAAFMLAAIPLVEVAAQLGFTGHPSSLQWRTGTVGLLSSALLTPAFGLILAVVTAYVCEHTVAHRIL